MSPPRTAACPPAPQPVADGTAGPDRSPGSTPSAGSILSIGSAGSLLSAGSAGSILSIGSAGSVLSIGSVGSLLSFSSVLSVRAVRAAGAWGSPGAGAAVRRVAATPSRWRLPARADRRALAVSRSG